MHNAVESEQNERRRQTAKNELQIYAMTTATKFISIFSGSPFDGVRLYACIHARHRVDIANDVGYGICSMTHT